MSKRLLSLMLAIMFALGVMPFASVSSVAADKYYSVSKALKYAEKNWNNGGDICAVFVSECLQAGNVDVYSDSCYDLYNMLKGKYGKAYKLTLTNGTSGKLSMETNNVKLEKGDPIFYKCNYCGNFEHVVICNGADSEGYSRDYAHNNAHDGKKTTYTYSHCGGESWTMYSIRMYDGPKLYGKKSNVGVPKITSVSNGADGITVEWSSVKGADKYYVYRKSAKSSWKRVKAVKKGRSFTDENVKNGAKYTYRVKAVDGKKVSQSYAGKTIKCLGAPMVSEVKNFTSSVKIYWSKVSSADGYYIYRKENSGSWKRIATVKGGKKTSYSDKSVKCSKSYKYTVRAYDGKVKGCFDNSGLKTIFLKKPAKITIENSGLGAVIKFSKIDAAKTYAIYRKSLKSDWKKISSVVGGKTTSFIDLDVKDGETYIYGIKALNGKYSSYLNKSGVKFKYSEPVVKEAVAEKTK